MSSILTRLRIYSLFLYLLTKVAVKLLVGLLIVFTVVGSMAYGAYGLPSLWVGVAASLVFFLNSIAQRWQRGRHLPGFGVLGRIFNIDELDDLLSEYLWKIVPGSIALGLGVGFGIALGISFSQALNISLLVKGVILGFTIGILLGVLMPLALHLARALDNFLEAIRRQSGLVAAPTWVLLIGPSIFLSFIFSLPIGLGEAFGGGHWAGITAGVSIGVLFLLSNFANPEVRYMSRLKKYRVGLVPTLSVGAAFGLLAHFFVSKGSGFGGGILAGVGGALGVIAGLWSGGVVGFNVRKEVGLVIAGISRYLREMQWPIMVFAAGYFAVTLLFAGIFASLNHAEQAFHDVPENASLWRFIYFSLMTITSLGYTDIEVTSALAKALVSAEAVIGIGWMVIFFACIIAYLENSFARIWTDERNLNVAAKVLDDVFHHGRVIAHDDLIDTSCVFYDPRNPQGIRSSDAIEQVASRLQQKLSDLQLTFSYQIAKQGYVLTRWTVRGTDDVSGTHERREMSGVQLTRILGGRIQQVWHNWDSPEWLQLHQEPSHRVNPR